MPYQHSIDIYIVYVPRIKRSPLQLYTTGKPAAGISSSIRVVYLIFVVFPYHFLLDVLHKQYFLKTTTRQLSLCSLSLENTCGELLKM